MQNRREFLETLSLGSAGLVFASGGILTGCRSLVAEGAQDDFETLTRNLLAEWCDGMIANQIDEPENPERHGALWCPACDFIHGRCPDAVYPFLHMAHATGEQRYLDAGINVFEWSQNVTGPDGRFTNDLDPNSWSGTTIFGAIALAEALHHHGDVLDDARRERWTRRLDQAAEGYLSTTFTTVDFTNINYGFTAVYGFNLIGRVLGKQKFVERSRQLAGKVKDYFTEPNKLLFGEGKPHHKRSGRGLLPVDLGYNVEESLNGVVMYALEEEDLEMQQLLVASMNGHLQFMLPDGGWDNSWGTRQAKWTWWGSRTSDGCQPGFSLMAHRNPAFGTAAYKNAELLKRCTADGLLHGGPHYVSHGVKPCIHHTFAHAKVMAPVQDIRSSLPKINTFTPLPRETADGIKSFPELAVWLVARGPWRGTVSAYDALYATKSRKYIQQATGGSLAVLYHEHVGPLLAASMAEYILVEERNMQSQPGQDFPLTTRIETEKDGRWYTTLYDLNAEVDSSDDGDTICFDVQTSLQDRDYQRIEGDVADYRMSYLLDRISVTINAESADGSISQTPSALVVPLISPTGEQVKRVGDKRIEIRKPEGTVVLESSVPLKIKVSEKGRIFNMVPGMECVPVIAELPRETGMRASCTISVVS